MKNLPPFLRFLTGFTIGLSASAAVFYTIIEDNERYNKKLNDNNKT